ncbi:response regulator transcription factor [Gracilibacillus salinarum]|uniref:Response regulator n=1 Tax=Gracilibacillus salinarum TaxID=2932255 RepID=A0ABY4GP29_9BACI|nr:response regulator [Gracilibacillus salinarum]UOQ85102.1 response regulator [Gracilibacillus salinarum]
MHKVYLVDDDVFVRQGIHTLIDWESYGFNVCGEADNGEDALADILKLQPDLVVTDIRMPVIDGLDLVKHCKESMEQTPNFIVVSGYNDFQYAQRALRYGVKDFIVKPIDQNEFHQTLERIAAAIIKENQLKQLEDKAEAVSLIKDQIIRNQDLCEHKAKHPFFAAHSYTYVKVEMNGLNIDYQYYFEQMEQALQELKASNHYILFEEKMNCFGLIINDRFLTENNLSLHPFLLDLYKGLGLDLHIYCGETVDEVEQLPSSYKDAKKCVQYKYLFREPVISTSMTKEKEVFFIDLDQAYYDEMLAFIEEKNTERIEQQMHVMMKACKELHFARDAVRTMVNRLNHMVLKSIKDMDANEQNITNLKEMLEWDQYSLSLSQLKTVWFAFIIDAASILHQAYQNNGQGTIYQIKKYIHMHFDQPLTLKSIANTFYMNPVYMGQLFKKTYGVYFKDYILTVRMDEAKKLLRTTDMKVYEVAEHVGFTNPDYFVTQFEKIVKSTPSQYRKKLLNRIS